MRPGARRAALYYPRPLPPAPMPRAFERATLADAVGRLRPGMRVLIPPGCGDPTALLGEIMAQADRLPPPPPLGGGPAGARPPPGPGLRRQAPLRHLADVAAALRRRGAGGRGVRRDQVPRHGERVRGRRGVGSGRRPRPRLPTGPRGGPPPPR